MTLLLLHLCVVKPTKMEQQTIFVKGMVCNRCLLTIETELLELGHTPVTLSLGEVSFLQNKESTVAALEERLTSLGFSLLENKNVKMTNEVKHLVQEVYSGDFDFPERFRFSDLVKKRLQKEYDVVSNAFIATEKKTIEQYIIQFRINKIKEYLVYTDLKLADIAFRLNFSSVAHLSAQFKQHTGLTPTFFKKVKREKSAPIFSPN